jgi:hypothetical protein
MSRPKLLPPLAPETLAALERIHPLEAELAPRHRVNADADPRLLEIVRELAQAEKHLRFMSAAPDPMAAPGTARWAKRCLEALTEVCQVAHDAHDSAFTLHLEAIQNGKEKPPFPQRLRVWMAWQWCSLSWQSRTDGEIMELLESGGNGVVRRLHVPTAGEVAITDGCTDLTPRDVTNHLKALGLPYAQARGKKRKSI